MGIRYRKSKNIGPFRITASKSGLSASVGIKGLRLTKLANGKTRTTVSIPGTGLSYISDSKSGDRRTMSSQPQAKKKSGCLKYLLFFLIASAILGAAFPSRREVDFSKTTRLSASSRAQVSVTPAPTPQPIDAVQLSAFEAAFRADLDNSFPGENVVIPDLESSRLEVALKIPEEQYQIYYTAALQDDDVTEWYGFLSDVLSFSDNWRSRWENETGRLLTLTITLFRARENTNQVIAYVVDDRVTGDTIEVLSHPLPAAVEDSSEPASSFILNTSTKVFHRPSCSDVSKITSMNRATSTRSRSALIADGYSPCGHCHP